MKYQKPKVLSLSETIENAQGTCVAGNSAGTNANKVCTNFGSSAGTGNDANTPGCSIGSLAKGQCGTGTIPTQGHAPTP